MSDDIVTRLEAQHWCDDDKCNLAQLAADEIERLRILLDNALEREYTNDARQLEIVRKVEADRDRWRKTAELMYEKANPKGAPICDCNVCQEYKYLAEGNIKMDYPNEVKNKYQVFWDWDEYGIVAVSSDGCLQQTGASFKSKDEAKQYAEWLNDKDNKKMDG